MNSEAEKQTFNRVADDYDKLVENAMSIKSSHNYYEEYKVMNIAPFIEKARKDGDPVKILDYGCGVGALDMAIDKNIKNVIIHGFDVSDESTKKAADALNKDGYVFTSDLNDLSDGYDIAILSVVLHHVALDEREEVINNILRRLKEGGVLLIIEHNMVNPFTKKTVDSCEFDKDAIMLDRKTAEDLITKVGFRKVSSRFITFFPEKLRFLWCIEKLVGWIPLGAQFMTIGYK